MTRFVLYALLGWCAEVVWTALPRFAIEPVHDAFVRLTPASGRVLRGG